jgi:hypothetical protein
MGIGNDLEGGGYDPVECRSTITFYTTRGDAKESHSL